MARKEADSVSVLVQSITLKGRDESSGTVPNMTRRRVAFSPITVHGHDWNATYPKEKEKALPVLRCVYADEDTTVQQDSKKRRTGQREDRASRIAS